MTDRRSCWCGNSELLPFSPEYFRCAQCETLVRHQMPAPEITRVVEDSEFYGREYWFSHQESELGCPNILVRTRADLPERCLLWLRTVLRYKLPPSRALELGSGPGGFVAMLQWAGFDASGLELSPWVVQFVRETFQVPMLLGPVEDQPIEPGTLDMIALMDVLEHLPDPASTMRHCLRLLKPDGILLIQTPCYPEGRGHGDMVAERNRFLEMLKPTDHLHLFSHRSIRDLFSRIGAEHVVFEPAVFAEYDMFAVVSRVPPVTHDAAEIDAALSARPTGRMIQALLDLEVDRSALRRRYAESEADRAARLEALEAQGRRLGEAEAERNDLRAEAAALRRHIEMVEADRAARLQVIETQGRRLGEVEAERNDLRAEVMALRNHSVVVEADRAARLQVIEQQGRRLAEVESQRDELLKEVVAQQHALRNLPELIKSIQGTRAYKLLRLLGRWITQALEQSYTESRGAVTEPRALEEMRVDAGSSSLRESSEEKRGEPSEPRVGRGAPEVAPIGPHSLVKGVSTLDDATAFWEQFRADLGPLVQAVAVRYPLVPRPYVEHFLSGLRSIEGNPRVLTYLESDLGAPGRSLALIDALIAGGVRVAGARCLDIGCSNGALLLAAKARGAATCLGLDASAARLVSARMVCAGSGIEFCQADARNELPGEYDLILCTDVLEHVPGWTRVIERLGQALAPAGAAFVTLHNARHPASVLSEPHYGVPGLSLLPSSDAAVLWARAREALGSTLDYDVYEWPSYAELEAIARRLGLSPTPWVDSEWLRGAFWRGYRDRRDALLRDTAAALDHMKLSSADTSHLLSAVTEYGELFTQDHERFERSPQDYLKFYLRYYAQPINILLRRS